MKHLLGEADPDETALVNEWLHANEANQAYYDGLKKVWDTSLDLAASSTVDENKAWQRFQQRVNNGHTQINAPIRELPKRSFDWRKIAAAVVVVAGLCIAGLWMYNNRPAEQLLAQTGNNTLTDTLPDGSTVTLNKESSLSYPSKFNGNKRAVTLKGEAFFHVTPNRKKPFVISVNDIEVTVVGTSFNIKTENGATDVIVETGIVRVTRNGQTVELHKNERLRAAQNDTLTKEKVNDHLYNYYRTKEFVCDDTPLWKLVETLNEAYQANIIIGRKELRDQRINIVLKNESLDRVLELVSETLNAKVTKNNGQLIIE
ncbi:MAG: iron dicitrate transport regulator FecR [Citrobacter freundii]|nr:MAG: iron dicitrate transport regulator FecR [Citrobacter freundii]